MREPTQPIRIWLADRCRRVFEPKGYDAATLSSLIELLDQLGGRVEASRDLGCDPAILLDALIEILAARPSPIEFAQSVRWDDFCLARAAAHGAPLAVRAFTRDYGSLFVSTARRFGRDSSGVDELAQVLRVDFMVGSASRRPRLSRYTGRARLEAWLRLSCHRRALDFVRARKRAESTELDTSTLASLSNLDREWMRGAYRAPVRMALHHALLHLSKLDRALLRGNAEGKTLDELAAAHGMHRSTVFRSIATARHRVSALVEAELRAMQLDPDALRGVISDLLSSTTLDFRRALGIEEPNLRA